MLNEGGLRFGSFSMADNSAKKANPDTGDGAYTGPAEAGGVADDGTRSSQNFLLF